MFGTDPLFMQVLMVLVVNLLLHPFVVASPAMLGEMNPERRRLAAMLERYKSSSDQREVDNQYRPH